MAKIQLLSEETIDKIAAGEVIERPASVVKELVENAIDANATAITIEIKDGGISFIRITDNGEGIEKEEVKNAFFRHATSKLHDAEEIENIGSLGFRGEALSSIAAVAQVEMITKTQEELTGIRYLIEGAIEKECNEVGVPSGTTVIVRNLFFNTPVRRKFLKTPQTEGGYINELCEHLALSRPDISFKFVNNGQVKFHTSGDGDLKALVYRIFGKDIAKEVILIDQHTKDIAVTGLLGLPSITRANRNFENYFINGRYIKSNLIAKAVEEGYKEYLMQHRFPFFIMNIDITSNMVDVNVHPTKMDVRFTNQEYLYDYLVSAVNATLKVHEMIPDVELFESKEVPQSQEGKQKSVKYPEPFEVERIQKMQVKEETEDYKVLSNPPVESNVIKAQKVVYVNDHVQMNLFEDKILTKDAMTDYQILGQLFDTYWLIAYQDKLLIMDQHAAHEKVKYERLVEKIKQKTIDTQNLAVPIIISLSGREQELAYKYQEYFDKMGFTVEEFGGNEIAIRSVPLDLYGKNEKEMFLEILDELLEEMPCGTPEFILEKIASMACKAAVKGNYSMTKEEVMKLLEELMTLNNPYNCPHGRPTIISMSKYEIEKKFKRIV